MKSGLSRILTYMTNTAIPVREPQTRQIGAYEFEVGYLDYNKALKTMDLMKRKLGAGFAGIASGNNLTADQQSTMGLEGIIKSLDYEFVDTLVETFGAKTRVLMDNGQRPYITKATVGNFFYGGNMSELFAWLAFCIEVNYGDFLDVLKSAKPSDAK